MKILFISYKYPPAVGGMEKQSFELITGMSRKCDVLHLVKKPGESEFMFFLFLKKRVKKIIQSHPNIDVIHCNDAVCAQFCVWIKAFCSAKLTCTFHGLDLVFPNKFYQKKLLSRLKQFDKFICVSQFTADTCVARGFDAEKVTVVKNGIDRNIGESPFTPDINTRNKMNMLKLQYENIIVSIGRPVLRKGFSWFAEKVLPKIRTETCFVLIGPETQRSLFSRLIYWFLNSDQKKQFDLFTGYSSDQNNMQCLSSDPKSHVYWMKNLSFSSLKYVVQQSTVFVMPNLSVAGDAEGFGLVALEASILSKIVVASYVDGIKDAVRHEKNGYFVPQGNEILWTSQINEILIMPEVEKMRTEMVFREYTLKNFSWDKMVDGYWKEFSALLSQKIETTELLSYNRAS